jgi:hypothetical protein
VQREVELVERGIVPRVVESLRVPERHRVAREKHRLVLQLAGQRCRRVVERVAARRYRNGVVLSARRGPRVVRRARAIGIEQCARNARTDVRCRRQRRNPPQVRLDARDRRRPLPIVEARRDVLGEHECFVRTDLDAQVAAVTAAALAGDGDAPLRDDVALQFRQPAIHANRLRACDGRLG